VPRVEFTFYGGAREFARYHGPEALLHGPAETGKTFSALWKLHLCALKYPNASLVIARKTQTSIYGTVLRTFTQKVLGDTARVEAFGGSKPEWFDYQNGARIWIAGLDKPGKVLSAEHDLVYVNQTEELELADWETLTTRTTGRAGHMPYSQTIGDANPSYPSHWMYQRPSLRMFYSRHEENPMLYDPATGTITAQGTRTMAVLDALTGVRKERLRWGKPAQAEGAVYEEWDASVHLIYADAMPKCDRFFGAQDWGYTNPGVLGIFGVDNDGGAYLVAQVYQTGRTIDWWVKTAQDLQQEFGYLESIACDPSEPAYIAAYQQGGLNATEANNAVLPGIDAVKQRLKARRLFVVRDSLRMVDESLTESRKPKCVEDELPMYVWSNKAAKEQPVKQDDHGVDMVRYAVMQLDTDSGPLLLWGDR
jgi:phage terminase large subunit